MSKYIFVNYIFPHDEQTPSSFNDLTKKRSMSSTKKSEFNQSSGHTNAVGFSLKGIQVGKKWWPCHMSGACGGRRSRTGTWPRGTRNGMMKRLIRYILAEILDTHGTTQHNTNLQIGQQMAILAWFFTLYVIF